MISRRVRIRYATIALLGASAAMVPGLPQQPSAPQRAVVGRYCATCHNSTLKTGGLALDAIAGGRCGRASGGVGEGGPEAARARDAAGRPAASRRGHVSSR